MAQSLPHFCTRCGTETVPKQKFCSICGLDLMSNALSHPEPEQSSVQAASSSSSRSPDLQVPQVSSPGDAIMSLPTQALPQETPQSSMQNQVQSSPQSPLALPGRRLNIRYLGISLVIIVVLGFFTVELIQLLGPRGQPSITTTTLGTTVDYAGVDITVVKAQKSQAFLDDPNSTSDGMLRLQLRAQNKTALTVNLPYGTITHVSLPGGKVVGPTYVKSDEHLAPNATKNELVDFAVPQDVGVGQVIFHLGSVDEAQLDIPLNGHANVDQYASKTGHPNQQVSYYGLNWTLTDTSLQFHLDGKQASKGMRYLILTLKVDNPLSQMAIPGSPYHYVQLNSNNAPINLIDTTLPVAFEASESGKMGTLTFLVPQDDTSFTLTLSNPSVDGFAASNPVNFRF